MSLKVRYAGHRVFSRKLLGFLGADAEPGGRGLGWIRKTEEGCSSGP